MFYKYFKTCCNNFLRFLFNCNDNSNIVYGGNNLELCDQDQDHFEKIDQSSTTLLNNNNNIEEYDNNEDNIEIFDYQNEINNPTLRLLQLNNDCKNENIDYKECLICLDNFTINNPLTLTLCSCGMNKTNFHLPCLLLWIEKNGKIVCPICNGNLYFEENLENSNAY
jgi:hypothetical protein